MDEVERQRRHFESISSTYYDARQQGTHLRLKQLLWTHFLGDKLAAFPQDGRVLEAMCGYGEGKTVLERHLGRGVRYTGFDYSRPLVEQARARYPGAEIFVGDATQVDLPAQYDLVILIGGLHHVYAHAADVMRRLARALKPGGHLVNFEPTHDNAFYAWLRNRIYRSNPIFDHATERAFALDELNGLYRGAGLEVVDQMYPGLLAYVLYYNPDAFPALNVGGEGLVKALFGLEKVFYRSWLARKFSFATLSWLRRAP